MFGFLHSCTSAQAHHNRVSPWCGSALITGSNFFLQRVSILWFLDMDAVIILPRDVFWFTERLFYIISCKRLKQQQQKQQQWNKPPPEKNKMWHRQQISSHQKMVEVTQMVMLLIPRESWITHPKRNSHITPSQEKYLLLCLEESDTFGTGQRSYNGISAWWKQGSNMVWCLLCGMNDITHLLVLLLSCPEHFSVQHIGTSMVMNLSGAIRASLSCYHHDFFIARQCFMPHISNKKVSMQIMQEWKGAFFVPYSLFLFTSPLRQEASNSRKILKKEDVFALQEWDYGGSLLIP